MSTKTYKVLFTEQPPEIKGKWDGAVWGNIPALHIDCVRPESSDHCPQTSCKLLYDRERLYGIFRVEDQYVHCIHTGFQSDVYKDSCVEFFVQPKNIDGYFNFEFNCGGVLLASYVTDPTRVAGKVKKFILLSADDDRQIQRYHSLPDIVEPEITQKTVWFLEFSIPFVVLEKYAGNVGDVSGQNWRANFYKCGNDTSHPHWNAWSPIPELNFHLPDSFGTMEFEKHIPKSIY